MKFKFLFSQDFDSQKQKKFLYNFKNNTLFKGYDFKSFEDIFEYDNEKEDYIFSIAKKYK